MTHEYLRALAGDGGGLVNVYPDPTKRLMWARLHGVGGPLQIVHNLTGKAYAEGDPITIAPTQEGPGPTGWRVVEPRRPTGIAAWQRRRFLRYMGSPFATSMRRLAPAQGMFSSGTFMSSGGYPQTQPLGWYYVPRPTDTGIPWLRLGGKLKATVDAPLPPNVVLPVIATLRYQMLRWDGNTNVGFGSVQQPVSVLGVSGGMVTAYSAPITAVNSGVLMTRADGWGTSSGTSGIPWNTNTAVAFYAWIDHQHNGRIDWEVYVDEFVRALDQSYHDAKRATALEWAEVPAGTLAGIPGVDW